MGVAVEGMGERGGRMYKEKQIKPTKKKKKKSKTGFGVGRKSQHEN